MAQDASSCPGQPRDFNLAVVIRNKTEPPSGLAKYQPAAALLKRSCASRDPECETERIWTQLEGLTSELQTSNYRA